MAAVKVSAMVTAVSAAHLWQPWMCPAGQGLLGGSTVVRCIVAAPVGISDSPGHRDECHYGATNRSRGRGELCRVSTLAVQASSSEKADRKGFKATIYDSLETERITVELFPELDFTLEGNFYPKLVKLVARKINIMFDEGGEDRVPDFLKHLGMQLSPHIVAEVMKLQNSSMEADRFFAWAANQPDFEHNAHTYNLRFWHIMKNYDGERPGRSLVHSLSLLGEMVAKGLTPGSLACNVLVDRLCKHQKAGAALRLTRVLERKGFPDIYTYNSLINGLGKVGLFKDVFALLLEMKQRECLPDVVTYNCIISGLCNVGMLKEVFELVDGEMMQRGCAPDRVTYNSIIHGLCNAGRWQEALKIFEELPGKEIAPDVVTYNSLIGGLLKCRRLDEARNIYDLMGVRGCELDRITYNILIDGFLDFSEVDEAWKVFHYMEDQGLSPDEVTYNTLIGGLIDNNKMTDALRVFTAMKEARCKPNATTYKLLGLSDEEQRSVSERDLPREMGNDSGSNNDLGESNMMEDEMKILQN